MVATLEAPALVLMNASERSDPLAALARAAARGNTTATRALLCEIGPPVFAVVEAVLGRSNPDVDDIAQEAFVGILKALADFRYESTVVHFARRIALRRASVMLRHRRAARRAANATVHLDDGDETLESADASPLDAAVGARQIALLRDLVSELPEEQGEALLMRVVLGHSVEEIAGTTDVPVNTVRSRLRTARAVLREKISADARLAELVREDVDASRKDDEP